MCKTYIGLIYDPFLLTSSRQATRSGTAGQFNGKVQNTFAINNTPYTRKNLLSTWSFYTSFPFILLFSSLVVSNRKER